MRERLGLVLIVAFVVVDLVLVGFALRPPDPPAPSRSAPAVDASDSASATPTERASESPSAASPTPTTPAIPETGPLLLAVGDDGALLRATRGSCRDDEPAVVESSRSQGRRLAETDVEGLTQALAVDVRAADDLTIVGLDADCTLTTFTSTDRGASWSSTDGSSGRWHRLAAPKRTAVSTPEGDADTPCVPLTLADVDAFTARLLCDDGGVLGTSDTGRSWVMLGTLPSAVAISFGSPSSGWGLTSRASCPAAVVRTTDGGASWDQIACIDGGEPRAIAVRGDTVVAQAGTALTRSTDDGTSFSPVG